MNSFNFTCSCIGSIIEKDTKKRRPFVVVGEFKDRKSFIKELKKELICPEDYDFRTIKIHSDDETNGHPIITVLHYLDDELDLSYP
jgi:hypothetical protein